MVEITPRVRMLVRRPTRLTRPEAADTPIAETAVTEAQVVNHEIDEEPHPDWTEEPLELPETKKAISLRVDRDVLDFFQKEGKGYQTRMNAVLRAYMKAKY